MFPADPSKVMLSLGFLILPAAKSAALDLMDRLEQNQISFTSGSKTPKCIHTRPQSGKLYVDQNSFYRLMAAHPGTEKTVKKKKRMGTWTVFSYSFVWGRFPDWDITFLLCKGRTEKKVTTESMKWDQTPPGILLRQYNVKFEFPGKSAFLQQPQHIQKK